MNAPHGRPRDRDGAPDAAPAVPLRIRADMTAMPGSAHRLPSTRAGMVPIRAHSRARCDKPSPTGANRPGDGEPHALGAASEGTRSVAVKLRDARLGGR